MPEEAAPAPFGGAACHSRSVLRARRLRASATSVSCARASAARAASADRAAAAPAVFRDEPAAVIGAPFAERRASRLDQAFAHAGPRERRRRQHPLRAAAALRVRPTPAALVAFAELVVRIRSGARARCGARRRGRRIARALATGREDDRCAEDDDDRARGPRGSRHEVDDSGTSSRSLYPKPCTVSIASAYGRIRSRRRRTCVSTVRVLPSPVTDHTSSSNCTRDRT